MRQALTVGVEEEFLLADAAGYLLPRFDALHAWLTENTDPAESGRFKPELQPVQIEAVSEVHTCMTTLASDLCHGRDMLSEAGDACALSVLPIGTAPMPSRSAAAPSALARYAKIHDRYREMIRDYTACGAHVHVGVGDSDLAVAVVNHLRPWLPTLIAVGANSPFHHGRDTGYSSWRIVEQARLPGSGLPPYALSADDYDNRIAALVECGTLVDEHMSFWLARPSEVYPTVEVRAADTAATVDDAVLQAVLTRGLVQTALRQLAAGIEGPRIDEQVGAAAVWSAARHGLSGPAVDPIAEVRVSALHRLGELIAWIADELDDAGDTAVARRLLIALEQHGTGAARQRRAVQRGTHHLVDAFRLRSQRSTDSGAACAAPTADPLRNGARS
ncbi:YbdK family carboxylate-amine ligase [Nocardia sp. NPDC051570]|uniref:carboxylate-amine ligase n=1 Tax=Nocardia sp. NPDC051570 TaxID=3364324 RepID=UPI0037AF5C06